MLFCSTFVPVMRRRDSGKKGMWPEMRTYKALKMRILKNNEYRSKTALSIT